MTDNVAKKERSRIMSKIKSKNTKPEITIKELLDGRIFKYQPKGILGNPDFANKREKIAIFIDGCFWHGCKKHCRMPNSNKKYWTQKIERNKKNDKLITKKLGQKGWNIIRLWEHEVKNDPKKCRTKILKKFQHSLSR